MKELTTRQVGFILATSIISLKLLVFPSLYADYAGVDGYLSITINLMIDLTMISVLLWVSKKNPHKTTHELIKEAFGGVVVAIMSGFLMLYFLCKATFIIKEYHNYLIDSLFVYLDWEIIIIPLLVLTAFIMSRSLRVMGRTIEVFFGVVVFGLIFTLFVPITIANFSDLLPFMENGIDPILDGAYKCSFASNDFIFFLVMIGKFKMERKSHIKIFLYALSSCLVIMLFYVIFFAVFASLTANETLAIGDLPLYSSFPSNVGRVDWITINLWAIVLILQLGVSMSFALHYFNHLFKIRNKSVGIIILLSVILIGVFVFFFNLSNAIDVVTNSIFINFTGISLLLPLLMVLATYKLRKKEQKEKKQNGKGINKNSGVFYVQSHKKTISK